MLPHIKNKQYRPTGQSRRTIRNQQQFDQDVFEGLPIRRWSKKWIWVAKSNPPPPPPPELPLPKDTHLLTPMSQTLLKAARNGTLNQLAKENGEGESHTPESAAKSTRLFRTNKWATIPRDEEPPEPEYLGRQPDTYTRHSRLVKKTMNGKVLIVEEELEDLAYATAEAGAALVSAVAAPDSAAQTPAKRRPPPPKRKPGRGRKPGFKKMVTFAEDGRALPVNETATPSAIGNGDGDDDDVEMGDADDATPDDQDQYADEGAEDQKDGKLEKEETPVIEVLQYPLLEEKVVETPGDLDASGTPDVFMATPVPVPASESPSTAPPDIIPPVEEENVEMTMDEAPSNVLPEPESKPESQTEVAGLPATETAELVEESITNSSLVVVPETSIEMAEEKGSMSTIETSPLPATELVDVAVEFISASVPKIKLEPKPEDSPASPHLTKSPTSAISTPRLNSTDVSEFMEAIIPSTPPKIISNESPQIEGASASPEKLAEVLQSQTPPSAEEPTGVEEPEMEQRKSKKRKSPDSEEEPEERREKVLVREEEDSEKKNDEELATHEVSIEAAIEERESHDEFLPLV